MKLSGLTKMVKRQLVCNVFHNDESDDFYIGTALELRRRFTALPVSRVR